MGLVAEKQWIELGDRYASIAVPVFCVMPNHMHAVIAIADSSEEQSRGSRGGVTPPLRKHTLGQMVAYYKYATTKAINQLQNTPGIRFWQRNYYERVIRNQREFEAVAEYIKANPLNWERDEYR